MFIVNVVLGGILFDSDAKKETAMLDLNIAHKAKAVKDRTGLFMDRELFTIIEGTGSQILNWCRNGVKVDDIKQEISKTTTIE